MQDWGRKSNIIVNSYFALSLTKYPWHNPESKDHRINNQIDTYHHVNLKSRIFIHHGFKKIYKLRQFFFSWDEECLLGKINISLQSKVRDASKPDKHSSKLICKSPHTAQDAILK